MKIISMSNCELKKNSNRIVFNDGDIQSQIMIIGEGPGQKEDEIESHLLEMQVCF